MELLEVRRQREPLSKKRYSTVKVLLVLGLVLGLLAPTSLIQASADSSARPVWLAQRFRAADLEPEKTLVGEDGSAQEVPPVSNAQDLNSPTSELNPAGESSQPRSSDASKESLGDAGDNDNAGQDIGTEANPAALRASELGSGEGEGTSARAAEQGTPESNGTDKEAEAAVALRANELRTADERLCRPQDLYSLHQDGKVYRRYFDTFPSDGASDVHARADYFGTFYQDDDKSNDWNALGVDSRNPDQPVMWAMRKVRVDKVKEQDTGFFEIYTMDMNTRTVTRVSPGEVFHQAIKFTVAGAFNNADGKYYYGQFWDRFKWLNNKWHYDSDFRIYSFDPIAKEERWIGWVNTGRDIPYNSHVSNGDMAFDARGNLLILQGSEWSSSVVSVTAEALKNGNGREISASSTLDTSEIILSNGFAFDIDGYAYVANKTRISKWDATDWKYHGAIYQQGASSGVVSNANRLTKARPPFDSIKPRTTHRSVSNRTQ